MASKNVVLKKIDLNYIKEELVDRVVRALEENLDDALCDFYYDGFGHKYRDGVHLIVKDYRFRPNIDDDIIDGYEKAGISNLLYDSVQGAIYTFSEQLDQELQDAFGVHLAIAGRMGAYWGITFEDAKKLIYVEDEKVAKTVNHILLKKLDYEEATESLDDDWSEVDFEDAIMEYFMDMCMSHFFDNEFDYYNTEKLCEALRFIDQSIRKGEEILNKRLRAQLQSVA